MQQLVDRIAEEICKQLFIEVEASGRHVHLTQEAVEVLFGPGHQLMPDKPLSQPGQYACKERITLTGPKGSLQQVVVLGPTREQNQVEVSLTDAMALGIKAPLRQSGDVAGSAAVTLSTQQGTIHLNQGLLVAKRHIHMSPEDAKRFGIGDGQLVSVKAFGKRPVIFQDTLVRVSPHFQTRMHIDYDEANGCGFIPAMKGLIITT